MLRVHSGELYTCAKCGVTSERMRMCLQCRLEPFVGSVPKSKHTFCERIICTPHLNIIFALYCKLKGTASE